MELYIKPVQRAGRLEEGDHTGLDDLSRLSPIETLLRALHKPFPT